MGLLGQYNPGMSYSEYKNRVSPKGTDCVHQRKVSVRDYRDDADYDAPDVQNTQLSQPFTAAILETIGYIGNELGATNASLQDIDDRIFGNCSDDKGDNAQKEPYYLEARILTALRDLLISAQEGRVLAQNLNARL